MAAPLTDAERERVVANIAAIKMHHDLEAVFKDFHEAGMVTGWRDIRVICPRDEYKIEGNVVCGDDLVLGSNADIMKRKR